MKKSIYKIFPLTFLTLISCVSETEQSVENDSQIIAANQNPKEMLKEAYQLFKEGKDEKSVELAEEVLAIGKETENDTLIGNALTSLCRNAQRELDTNRLAELSEQLKNLTKTSGNKKWMMYRAHQNAEMWRLIGNMNKAESFYNESMSISKELGSMGMYTIDHFNKSFVSTAKGDYETANNLIKRYYQLREENEMSPDDAYGLIALAYLLEQKKNYQGACEVAIVSRRLFKEQNLFPEPPDEKPLIAVEDKVKEIIKPSDLSEIASRTDSTTVSDLLDKYLK
jgi:tetratricopeptide (TPR) repeat protein